MEAATSRQQCQIARANFSERLRASGQPFCSVIFDGLSCMGPVPAGMTQILPCTAIQSLVSWNESLRVGSAPSSSHDSFAFRVCKENGTWLTPNANYTACIRTLQKEPKDAFSHKQTLQILYLCGYSISLTALIIAMIIFIYFKKLLSCVRNKLHCHFFVALSIRIIDFYAITLFSNLRSVQSSSSVAEKEVCFALMAIWNFTGLAKFAWMSAEGVYLVLVILCPFRIEALKISFFCFAAWGFSALLTIIWIIVRRVRNDFTCNDGSSDWLIAAPILFLLLVNSVVAVFIAITLYEKVRGTQVPDRRSRDQEDQADADELGSPNNATGDSKRRLRIGRIPESHRKAMRSVLILVPLLGITYLIFLIPLPNMQIAWSYMNATLNSAQGFFVALVLCFLNHEVQSSISSAYRVWKDARTLGLGRTGARSMAMESVKAPLRTTTMDCA